MRDLGRFFSDSTLLTFFCQCYKLPLTAVHTTLDR